MKAHSMHTPYVDTVHSNSWVHKVTNSCVELFGFDLRHINIFCKVCLEGINYVNTEQTKLA